MSAWQPAWLHDDPRHWRTGSLDRGAMYAAAQRSAARPGFVHTARRFAHGWLATQHAHPALRAVFRNSQRYLMLVSCYVLHHRRDPSDPRSGVTAARVRAMFEQALHTTLEAGETQVKAMLAHARLAGLLAPAPVRGDARQRPLQPTPLLHHILEQWVEGFLLAMDGDDAYPLPAAPQTMVHAHGLVPAVFAYRMSAVHLERFVLWQDFAEPLRWVLGHDHGYRVFLHLVEAFEPQPDGTAVLPLSANELAGRSGVARGTVRNLLRDAQAQGWFVPAAAPADPRRWTAAAARTALNWIALELEWMHGLACAAFSHRDALAPPH